MKPSYDGSAQADSRRLEVGTQACAGGRLRGRKNSDARANGFSPRLFDFVGKTRGADSVSALPAFKGMSYASLRFMKKCRGLELLGTVTFKFVG